MPSRIEGFTSPTNMSCNAHIGDDIGMLKDLKRCLGKGWHVPRAKTWLGGRFGNRFLEPWKKMWATSLKQINSKA